MSTHTLTPAQIATEMLANAELAFQAAGKERNHASEKVHKIVTLPKLRAMVGKCFKYRNSYSCPQPHERWWLYVKLVRVEDGCAFAAVHVQTDYRGKTTINGGSVLAISGELSEGYIPISTAEFDTAMARAVRTLTRACSVKKRK